MNTSIILLIVGIFLAVGVIIYLLTSHKKKNVKSLKSSQCSGPDFTGKTWKKIYTTDTSGVIVHFDIDTNNPSNIFVVEAQTNYVGLPIFTLQFSKNNGNNWTVFNPNTFGVQPWYICEYGKFFKNFQMTCGNTLGDEMPFVMFSRDMFNTVASKTVFNPSPAPTYLRIDTFVLGGKNKVCSSDDGLTHFISASSLPGIPSDNTYGFLKLTIDSSFNVLDTTWTVKKGAVNMACSSDAKYVLLTWSDNSNVIAELSQDYGKTWTTVDSNNSQYRTGAYNAFVSSNGDVIVYSYNIINDQITTSYTRLSFDFGKSWITLNIDNNLDSYNISDSGWNQIYSIDNGSGVIIKYSNHLGNSIVDTNLPPLDSSSYVPTKLYVSKDYNIIAISTDTNIYLLTSN